MIIRLMSNKTLLTTRGDARLELLDVTEELAVHKQHRPTGKQNDVWLGTKEEWQEEYKDIKRREKELEGLLAEISREMHRRDNIYATKSLVASHSRVANVVFLEDVFMQRGTNNLKKALKQ